MLCVGVGYSGVFGCGWCGLFLYGFFLGYPYYFLSVSLPYILGAKMLLR